MKAWKCERTRFAEVGSTEGKEVHRGEKRIAMRAVRDAGRNEHMRVRRGRRGAVGGQLVGRRSTGRGARRATGDVERRTGPRC